MLTFPDKIYDVIKDLKLNLGKVSSEKDKFIICHFILDYIAVPVSLYTGATKSLAQTCGGLYHKLNCAS